MELWGVGFNGWGQLQFDSPGGTPDDVRRFTRIWRDESIQVLALYLTATIGKSFEPEYLLFCPSFGASDRVQLVTCLSRGFFDPFHIPIFPVYLPTHCKVQCL